MSQPRTINPDIADLAANWLAGLARAFEETQFSDTYVRNQAPVNAQELRRLVEAINGAGWADSDPEGGVIEAQTQIMMATADGEVPPSYRPNG